MFFDIAKSIFNNILLTIVTFNNIFVYVPLCYALAIIIRNILNNPVPTQYNAFFSHIVTAHLLQWGTCFML